MISSQKDVAGKVLALIVSTLVGLPVVWRKAAQIADIVFSAWIPHW